MTLAEILEGIKGITDNIYGNLSGSAQLRGPAQLAAMLSGPPTQSPLLPTTALANFLGGIGVLGGMRNFEQTQDAERRAGIPEGYLQFERALYNMMRDKMKGGPVQMFNSVVAPPLISPAPAAGAADPIAQAAGMTPPAWWR